MSWVSGIVNNNRVQRFTVTLPASQAGATSIWATIGPVPPSSRVRKVSVFADNNITGLTCEVIPDAAAWNLGANAARARTVQATATGNMANNAIVYDFTATVPYIEDERLVPYISIRLSAGTITTGTVFTVVVELEPLVASNLVSTGIPLDRTFRALRYNSALDAMEDITELMLGNSNPYLVGTTSQSESALVLANASDFLYIGSTRPFTRLAVTPQSGAAASLVSEYWNGSAWTTQAVQNNTSDRQATPSTFTYAGDIVIPTIAAWRTRTLPQDPLTLEEARIVAGTQQPTGNFLNPPRYWMRFGAGTVTGAVRLVRALLV